MSAGTLISSFGKFVVCDDSLSNQFKTFSGWVELQHSYEISTIPERVAVVERADGEENLYTKEGLEILFSCPSLALNKHDIGILTQAYNDLPKDNEHVPVRKIGELGDYLTGPIPKNNAGMA